MSEQRYALIWESGLPSNGCFCPAGGMTMEEAERSRSRLQDRARANDFPRVFTTKIVPYVYDIDRDDIEGLPLGVDRPEPLEGKTYSLNLGKSMNAQESVLMHVQGNVRVVEIEDGQVRFTGKLPYSDSVSYDRRIFRSLSHIKDSLFELPRPRFAELYREAS